jgi:hypothetical protein
MLRIATLGMTKEWAMLRIATLGMTKEWAMLRIAMLGTTTMACRHRSSTSWRARVKIASSIGSVRTPVFVF